MDITPCRTPEVPPSTGRRANNKPTAQSCKRKVATLETVLTHNSQNDKVEIRYMINSVTHPM